MGDWPDEGIRKPSVNVRFRTAASESEHQALTVLSLKPAQALEALDLAPTVSGRKFALFPLNL